MNDPLADAVERCANYGGGTAETWTIPETARVQLADAINQDDHLLAGSTITFWTDHQ